MGIGADSAEQLAKRGYHVVLADINKSAAEEAASSFRRGRSWLTAAS